jgi:two-component system chemotaxis response regulator CheY
VERAGTVGTTELKMRFLVVDDSSAMRRILINTLTRLGYTDLLEAVDGREALEKLSSSSVDLVVTDWIMPEMDGIQFVRAPRETDATKDLPVLMVTTHATRDHIVEAMTVGVNGYIVKPFTLETFQQKIESMLPRHTAATAAAPAAP